MRLNLALDEVAAGRIRRGNDWHYRRGYGFGYMCDTVIYTLEERGHIKLHTDGTVTLTDRGAEARRLTEERKRTESDADPSRGTERVG